MRRRRFLALAGAALAAPWRALATWLRPPPDLLPPLEPEEYGPAWIELPPGVDARTTPIVWDRNLVVYNRAAIARLGALCSDDAGDPAPAVPFVLFIDGG